MTDAVIDRIIREMGERGDDLEARALAVVQYLYEDLDLSELIEVLRAATELDSPLARLGYADQLLSIFDEVAAELGEPPPQLVQAVRQAVETGVTGTAEMFAASQVVTSAFTVPPDLQLEWMEEAERRMKEFWGNEPVRFRQEIHDAILDGLKRGQGIDQMAKRIKDRVGVSRSRASLIARDQVGSASAYAAQKSQQLAGCEEFIWRTASDRRVRPEHAARNGKKYRWDSPPDGETPGSPVNCRCVAIAVIPGE